MGLKKSSEPESEALRKKEENEWAGNGEKIDRKSAETLKGNH
jgi:hypothetical protein